MKKLKQEAIEQDTLAIENEKQLKRKKRKQEKLLKAISKNNYINHKIQIENKYASLLTLIDSIYPPTICTLCDTISSSTELANKHFKEQHESQKKYLCIHPHCADTFLTKGALRFHISRSHIVNHTKRPLPDPSFLLSPSMQPQLLPQPPPLPKVITPSLSPPKQKGRKFKAPMLLDLIEPDLTPSPPPSPFSLYHSNRKNQTSKKPQLSSSAEAFLNIKYPPLQCPACLQTFNRKTNVIKHLTEQHLGQEPYKCVYPACAHPRLYATREGLIYHIVRIHDNKA